MSATIDDKKLNGAGLATLWGIIKQYIVDNPSIPKATASTLGCIMVGTTLGVNNSGVLNLASGVVTAGTYKSVTVDTYGRVTAGTNPNTLAGYGITDAKISNGSIILGENSITPITSLSGYATQTWVQQQGYLTEETYKGTVTQVKVGTTAYDPTSGVVSLPAYPTTLPASDVYSWAKAASKPSYTASEVGAASSGHTHTTSIASSTAENQLTLAFGSKYAITAGGTSYVFTMPANPDTWRPLGTGANDACAGNDSRLSDSRPASDVYSWAKASSKPTYTASEVGAATSGHTHTTSIATSTGTNQITLAHGGKYAITAGGTSYIFTMPSDNNTTYSAGTGLSLSGTTFSLATSGVTAGTYKRVTVDAYGRVTSGDNTDANDNTWRNIYTGGTSRVGTGTNTKAINFVAGSNVSISYEAAGTGDGQSGNANYFNVKIAATNTTYSAATQSAAGLMSAADKKKLDGIASGANAYSLPTASADTLGGIKVGTTLSISSGVLNLATSGVTAGTYKRVTVDSYGRVTSGDNSDADTNTWRGIYVKGTSSIGTGIDTKALNFAAGSNVSISFAAAGTGSGQSGNANYGTITINATDTTYSAATQSAAGLMSAADKTKLDGISLAGLVGSTAIGDTVQPVYWNGSAFKVISYTIAKSVPSDAKFTDTNTWRPLGTGASDACAGNDSRLSNSRPASDVYSWAKESTKPSYAFNEITAGAATIGDGANYMRFRTNATYESGIYYSTPGNEALVFANKYNVTSWIFANTSPSGRADWTGLTPAMQIKKNCVYINSLIASGTDPSYNLYVNGSMYVTSINGVNVGSSPKFTDTTYTFTNKGATLAWSTTSTIATVGGVDIKVTMPANPNTDHYAWSDITGKPSTYAPSTHSHNYVVGSYTGSGGQQKPNYFGKNKVGFLMMNTTVNSNSQYKDWIIMDCYNGNDVGGGVAFGVNRQALGAYIMRSAAERTAWAESAELLGTHNYDSYAAKKTEAIKNISRSGTTFTATRCDGTTFTFTQQDNNTTYTLAGLMGSTAIGGTTQPIYWTGSAFAKTTYTLGKSVPSDAKFTDTNTWRPIGTGASDAAAGNHTHTLSIATDSGTNSITLAFGTKYKLTAGGTSFVFTMPSNPNTNTTYTIATGDSDGQIKVTPSSGSAYNVSVKGLGSNAYTSTSYLPLAGGTMGGTIFVGTGLGISDASGNGLLCYKPDSWTGVSNIQWGLGTINVQGVIRSSASNLVHYKGDTAYDILDTSNSSVSLSGSTLTVKINGTTKSLTNTDVAVNQSETTTSSYRGIVLGYNSNSAPNTGITGNCTNVVYTTNNLVVQPSSGNIYTAGNLYVGCGAAGVHFGGSGMYWHNSSNAWTANLIKSTDGSHLGIMGDGVSTHTVNVSGTLRSKNHTVWGNASSDISLGLVGSQYTMEFLIGAGNVNRGIYNRTGSAWMLYFDASNTIMNYGNVGVGVSSPSYLVHVNGNVGAMGFTNTSDIRTKNIVKDNLSVKLTDIAEAPLFDFKWKDTSIDTDLHIGSSAQYWKNVIPEAVSVAKDEIGTLSMQYDVIALSAVISVAKETLSLKEKVALLETRVESLEKKIREYELN